MAGQDASGKPAVVRFVAQAVPAGMGQVVMRMEDKISDPFDMPVNNFTAELKSPGRLFQLTIVGKETAIGVVKLPEEGAEFIVLLLATKKDSYESVVLPANGAGFRPGDVYLNNTSDTPVQGQIGDSRFTLAAGKGRIHQPSGAVDGTYYDVAFVIREESGKSRFLTTSRWPVTDRTRSYVFFFKDPTTDRIKFRAVEEFIPVKR